MAFVLTEFSPGFYSGATDAEVTICLDAFNTTFAKVSYDLAAVTLTSPKRFTIRLAGGGWEPLAMVLLGPSEEVVINEVADGNTLALFDDDLDPGEAIILWLKGV